MPQNDTLDNIFLVQVQVQSSLFHVANTVIDKEGQQKCLILSPLVVELFADSSTFTLHWIFQHVKRQHGAG